MTASNLYCLPECDCCVLDVELLMRIVRRIFSVGFVCLAVCLPTIALGDVKLASIFGDSMVLQREMSVPVWGWADAGEQVTVEFGGQSVQTVADPEGRWKVSLDSLKAKKELAEHKEELYKHEARKAKRQRNGTGSSSKKIKEGRFCC